MLLLALGGIILSCTPSKSSLADQERYTEDESQYTQKFDVQFDKGEQPIRYGYYYIVSTVSNAYQVRVFHPQKKTLTDIETYSTPALTLLHGQYRGYWDDGSIREQGQYQYGRKHGQWLECELGKGKSSCGGYVNQLKEGQWTQMDSSGLLESVYTWHDGLRHGKFFLYDTLGKKINEGIYKSDTLIGELFKQPQIQPPYLLQCKNSQNPDLYACTESTLLQTIYDNLKYPAEARRLGIEGKVIVQWDVMQDGTVSNLRVPKSLCNEVETECRRVLHSLPQWVPASKEGKPVKWTVTLPITFSID